MFSRFLLVDSTFIRFVLFDCCRSSVVERLVDFVRVSISLHCFAVLGFEVFSEYCVVEAFALQQAACRWFETD